MKRAHSIVVAGLFILSLVSRTLAGITVTSYSTTALTNGFAPSLNGPYFAQETLENITPALADVSGDWIGPNEDGTPDTWHFVGTSQASSTTTIIADGYTVTGAGSFAYEINTTADFVNPGPSAFTPSGAANYNGFFETDTFVAYSISAQLNRRGRVRLASIEAGEIFDYINVNATPLLVNQSGVLPAGHYNFLASTSLIAPNLQNGVSQFAANGSYENVIFSVQVPEPIALGGLITVVTVTLRWRDWCVVAHK